jgi:hypothetical protein
MRRLRVTRGRGGGPWVPGVKPQREQIRREAPSVARPRPPYLTPGLSNPGRGAWAMRTVQKPPSTSTSSPFT